MGWLSLTGRLGDWETGRLGERLISISFKSYMRQTTRLCAAMQSQGKSILDWSLVTAQLCQVGN